MGIRVLNPTRHELEHEHNGRLYIVPAETEIEIHPDEAAQHIADSERLGKFGLVLINPQEEKNFESPETYRAELRKRGLTAQYRLNLERINQYRVMEAENLAVGKGDHLTQSTIILEPMSEIEEYEHEFMPAAQRTALKKIRKESERVANVRQGGSRKVGRPRIAELVPA